MTNILILGDATDAHAAHLKQALEQAGVWVNYLNIRQFPSQLQLSWQPQQQQGNLYLPGGIQLAFDQIKSIFWRSLYPVQIPALDDAYQHRIAINDSMSALQTLFKACPARWVNSWQAYQFHKEKPLQLSTASQLGVTIPGTLITNNPQEVIAFCESYKKTIFKPVYGGAHTQPITAAHLEPQRLKEVLSIAPVTLQEFISGTNIRTYVIEDKVYGAEIRTTAIDFREDTQAELIPITIPEAIQAQCLAIARAFDLEWTAIDWRLKPNGEYVFLEANPSPMFMYFEQKTGFPITQNLVDLLIK
jgi:glutathione synthase/RimK-type ligase-like ATP-grasp enzyme